MWLSAVASVAALFATTTSAITIAPSNGTIPTYNSTNTTLEITIPSSDITSKVFAPWALGQDTEDVATQLENVNLRGLIRIANRTNYNTMDSSDIAFISCDPGQFEDGELQLEGVVEDAAKKAAGGSQQTFGGNTSGAVVLYSLLSSWCNFTASTEEQFDYYENVFSLTSPAVAQMIFDMLSEDGEPPLANIHPDAATIADTEERGRRSYGSAPTTTIAMVILYVITGLITLLFLAIILSGAYRAHRHPERYRNRTLLGRPVEGSRARGIAAAMLDTIPIVKFGEREAPKPNNDIEMQNGTQREGVQDPSTTNTAGYQNDTNRSSNAAAADTSPTADGTPPTTTTTTTDDPVLAAEAGLACSVCTDDFVKGQDTRVLPCNHKFHPECIDPWLLNVSGTCPLCRVDLNPPQERQPSDTPSTDGTAAPGGADGEGEGNTTSQPHRDRRSGALSTILHRALNRQHMSSASPQQRIEALRDLRRQNGQPGETPAEGDERMRSRVGNRVSRLLGRGREESGEGEERGGAPAQGGRG